MRQAIGKSQFDGFNLTVVSQHGVTLCEIKTLEQIKCNQGHQAVPVRWNLPHVKAPVIDTDRVHPIDLVGRQVSGAEVAACALHKSCNFFCQSATVKAFCVVFSDRLQGISMTDRAPDLTGFWRTLGRKSVKP